MSRSYIFAIAVSHLVLDAFRGSSNRFHLGTCSSEWPILGVRWGWLHSVPGRLVGISWLEGTLLVLALQEHYLVESAV